MYEMEISHFKQKCISKLSNIKSSFDSKYRDIEIENAQLKEDIVDMTTDISSKISKMLDELN